MQPNNPHLVRMRIVIAALALLPALFLALPAHSGGGDRPTFRDRPAVGQQVRFTDLRGNVFQPRALFVVSRSGTMRARLPDATNNAVSEDHLDLSGTPIIGQVFRGRLAPSDAARQGTMVGPVYRLGDALVLDAREATQPLQNRDLILTATFPGDGAVSYRLGRLPFAPGTMPTKTGRPAGTGYLVNGALVLAADGRDPLITDWSKVFGN
jgi:hypothetical protein